jgi:glycosyltransferase involved in cell wall biosynthesis
VVGDDGECADLVTPGDVSELELALEALLDDPERRARMGQAGRRRVLEKFSWHAVAEATAAAYAEEIANSHNIENGANKNGETASADR